MRFLFRILHTLLVLTLTILLLWSVYYAFSLLSYDPQQPQVQSNPEIDESERIPSVQNIVSCWIEVDERGYVDNLTRLSR